MQSSIWRRVHWEKYGYGVGAIQCWFPIVETWDNLKARRKDGVKFQTLSLVCPSPKKNLELGVFLKLNLMALTIYLFHVIFSHNAQLDSKNLKKKTR